MIEFKFSIKEKKHKIKITSTEKDILKSIKKRIKIFRNLGYSKESAKAHTFTDIRELEKEFPQLDISSEPTVIKNDNSIKTYTIKNLTKYMLDSTPEVIIN